MDTPNEPKKKQSWLSSLSQKFSQLKKSLEQNSTEKNHSQKNITQNNHSQNSISESKTSQSFPYLNINQALLKDLSRLKTIIAEADSLPHNPAKLTPILQPTVSKDEFDIEHFDKKYDGLKISAPILKKSTKSTAKVSNKPNIAKNDEIPDKKSILEIRKEFIAELKRLKKIVIEKDLVSDEDNEGTDLLKTKLMDDLNQFKEMLKATATPEEKDVLTDAEWDSLMS